jgi:hypothetical protein
VAEVAEKKEHPRGVARTIWVLEHTQDLVSIVVGVLLAGLAVVVPTTWSPSRCSPSA